jgi:hypothetical protein
MPRNPYYSLVASRCTKSNVLYIHTMPKASDFVEIGLIIIDFHTHESTLSSDQSTLRLFCCLDFYFDFL